MPYVITEPCIGTKDRSCMEIPRRIGHYLDRDVCDAEETSQSGRERRPPYKRRHEQTMIAYVGDPRFGVTYAATDGDDVNATVHQ